MLIEIIAWMVIVFFQLKNILSTIFFNFSNNNNYCNYEYYYSPAVSVYSNFHASFICVYKIFQAYTKLFKDYLKSKYPYKSFKI